MSVKNKLFSAARYREKTVQRHTGESLSNFFSVNECLFVSFWQKRPQHRTQEYKINTHHSSQTFFLYVLLFCTVLLRKVYFSFLLSSSWDLFHVQCVIGSQDFIMRYQRKEISGCSALIFKMYATT